MSSSFMNETFKDLKVPLEVIKQVTKNFGGENELGRGGFGKVYKADFHSEGRTMAAIKRLNRDFGQGDIEFWKEIMLLSNHKHENLIKLIGFCDESDEKVLIYEYAPNRSLDCHLNNDELIWIQRLKICIGAARGLEYLHNPRGGQQRVIHRDIKSSNILLDENWNAKIADFGLSRLGPANQEYTFLVSNPAGTWGYIDPMYIKTMVLTKESDVYSFGVVLFEVLCSRLGFVKSPNDQHNVLSTLAKEHYQQKKLDMIINESLRKEINQNCFDTFTAIAYECLNDDQKKRPPMKSVLSELETALDYQEGRIVPAPKEKSNMELASSSELSFNNYVSEPKTEEDLTKEYNLLWQVMKELIIKNKTEEQDSLWKVMNELLAEKRRMKTARVGSSWKN